MTDKTWLERLQELADAHPHEVLDLVGSPEMIAAITTGRVSVHDALDAWQRGLIDDTRAMQLSGAEDVAELYQIAYSSDVEIRFARAVVVQISGVMFGEPVIAGTQVSVDTIISDFQSGGSKHIEANHPELPPGSLIAAYKWTTRNT